MVKPVAAGVAARPVSTGIERSNSPPPIGGRLLTARGDGVEEIGVPDGPDGDSDCSNPDTLDRQA
jgi:hypothetical protein